MESGGGSPEQNNTHRDYVVRRIYVQFAARRISIVFTSGSGKVGALRARDSRPQQVVGYRIRDPSSAPPNDDNSSILKMIRTSADLSAYKYSYVLPPPLLPLPLPPSPATLLPCSLRAANKLQTSKLHTPRFNTPYHVCACACVCVLRVWVCGCGCVGVLRDIIHSVRAGHEIHEYQSAYVHTLHINFVYFTTSVRQLTRCSGHNDESIYGV